MIEQNDYLQQASVDYLSQINSNVVALNSTAMAQRDIAEKQSYTQNVTKDIMMETRQNTVAAIQNQSYMAYGTFQHDMQGMAGFTDSNTRMALINGQIAGKTFVGDVQQVAGNIGMAGIGLGEAALSVMSPGATQNMGLVKLAAMGLGVGFGHPMYTQTEAKSLAQAEWGARLNDWTNTIRGYAQLRGGEVDVREYGETLNTFRERILRPGYNEKGEFENPMVFSNEQKEEFGRFRKNTLAYLRESQFGTFRPTGYSEPEAVAIMETGLATELNLGGRGGATDLPGLKKNMQDFTNTVVELGNALRTSAVGVGQAISDLRMKTGMSLPKAADFLTDVVAAGKQMGLTFGESLNMGTALNDAASRQGVAIDTAKPQYLNIRESIYSRMQGNDQYTEFVSRMGGQDAVASMEFNRNYGFMRSGLGMLYMGAKDKGVGADAGMLDVALGGASAISGDVGDMLRLKYRQTKADAAEANLDRGGMFLNMFQAIPKFQGAKRSDIIGGKYQDEFKGFLSLATQTTDEADLDILYQELYGTKKTIGPITQELKAAATRRIEQYEKPEGFFAAAKGAASEFVARWRGARPDQMSAETSAATGAATAAPVQRQPATTDTSKTQSSIDMKGIEAITSLDATLKHVNATLIEVSKR